MTYKAAAIAQMLNADVSGRMKVLHDELISLGLKTKISSNTDTLLFEAVNGKRERFGLIGLRGGNTDVFSFARPYWVSRFDEVNNALAELHNRHFIDTEGFVSNSQYSVRQVRISDDTMETLKSIVAGLIARHVRDLHGGA